MTSRGGEIVRSWIAQIPTVVAVVLALWTYSLRLESRLTMLETRLVALEKQLTQIDANLRRIPYAAP